VKLASRNSGLPVRWLRFQELKFEKAFDGIWACASLLHVPVTDEVDVFHRLIRALKSQSVLYVSYKAGEGERSVGERHFRDHTPGSLAAFVAQFGELEVIEIWETADARPDRMFEHWVNGLLRKTCAASSTTDSIRSG
jgi:hypothetical protein